MGLLLGLGLLAVSIVALYIALPRGDETVGFLRNHHAQSYYVIFVISAFVIGALNVAASLTAFEALTGYR